jgi:hypothetical protein
MTLSRGTWPIRKDVPEVAAAARADLLRTNHAVTAIADPADMRLIERPEEARPAGAGVEFRIRPEKRQPAEPARVRALLLVVEKYAAEGSLGAVLEQHAPLIAAEALCDLMTLRVRRGCQIELTHGATL